MNQHNKEQGQGTPQPGQENVTRKEGQEPDGGKRQGQEKEGGANRQGQQQEGGKNR